MIDAHGGLEWRYLPGGKVAHAIARFCGELNQTAVCGASPVWYLPSGAWCGTGSQAEYERAAGLPRCRRCLAKLASTG